MTKVVTVVGARPQFIKCAMVSRELRKVASEVLVHTGQHYDDNMSGIFFRELDIPKPDYNLGVGSGRHGAQTGEMLTRIEEVLLEERPDHVLVYGDTNSTLAGALASAKLDIPVAHVEAGLRSFNRRMPEEVNRLLTDHLSSLLFCPTETAVKNLAREGITKGVELVGDVMYDSVLHSGRIAEDRSSILMDLGLQAKKYVLATVHRAENTDDLQRFQSIWTALHQIAGAMMKVIVPLHPRVTKMHSTLARSTGNLVIIEPVSYLDMLMLEKNAKLILTDSGGVQKEAYFFRIPCITLRDETEWVETVESGWNRLAGADREKILSTVKDIERTPGSTECGDFFGDGVASRKVVACLANFLK